MTQLKIGKTELVTYTEYITITPCCYHSQVRKQVKNAIWIK